MHLVCQRFHGIANYYPHNLTLDSDLDASALKKSSRVYGEVKISDEGNLFENEHFTAIEAILKSVGIHVRKLSLESVRMSKQQLATFLKHLSEIQSLTIDGVKVTESKEDSGSVEEEIKLCCKLQELSISSHNGLLEETLLNCLKESQLSKLSIGHIRKMYYSSDYRRRNLEYKRRKKTDSNEGLVDFLKEQKQLKVLKTVWSRVSDQTFNTICDTCQELETLEIKQNAEEFLELSEKTVENVKKLKNLRKIVMSECRILPFNPLRGLLGPLFGNLEVLESSFHNFPPEAIVELSRSITNLKKLTMQHYPQKNLDCLKGFQNLEDLTAEIRYFNYNGPDESLFSIDHQIFPNVRYLHIHENFWEINSDTAKEIVHNFPNLEELKLTKFWSMADECIEIFLENLKQMESFISDDSGKLEISRKVVDHLKNYGKNLKRFHIETVDFDAELLRRELKDLKGLRISSSQFDIVL